MDKICNNCLKKFQGDADRKYCSKLCFYKNSDRVIPFKYSKRCSICKNIFLSKRLDKKFCSKKCSHRHEYILIAQKKPKKTEKRCFICNKSFVSIQQKRAIMCNSLKCHREYKKRWYRKKKGLSEGELKKKCVVCGNNFNYIVSQKYCPKCSKKHFCDYIQAWHFNRKARNRSIYVMQSLMFPSELTKIKEA